MTPMQETVVVLGASPKPERYAHQAVLALTRHGHRVIPVHPRPGEIGGWPVVPALDAVTGPVHTLALYLGPARSEARIAEIVALAPGRVILNPGTESPWLEAALNDAGIPWAHDCILRMLDGGRF
ncbi:CoA-binding protein [Thioalkalivibrio denitrificans]|uniref:CoA-binding protein n=1 Tax=Thioalkalivibrio denitrificans TaxID=108003 RepID=A0A1V3NEZ7_9GAMM|nr:CoA-binding protein [Thioalkalivibrio denitrificans]OOG23503.1 CoA-binding protein [Thioalkalivibrio denitrificans]